MEEQANERFDVDNDFEGGEWIGGEFFYRSKRQKREQTEEDRLYGVFAGSSDEEGDGRRGRREKKGKADYTKPVAFVSHGVAQPSQERQQQGEAADTQPAAHSARQLQAGQDGGARAGLGAGLGFSAGAGVGAGSYAGGGLGFAPSTSGVGGEEDEEDGPLLPTAFGQRVRKAAEEKRQKSERQAKAARVKASGAVDDIGNFERHGKGIASKIMSKMGFVPGQGLGRAKQGIARPIDNKLRPKGMGLGFGEFKEHKLLKPEQEEQEKAKEATAAPGAQAPGRGLWRRRKAAARKGRVYKTAEELVAEAAKDAEERGAAALAARPVQTIIDMRGPQARVVSNLEHLHVDEEAPEGDSVPMPELQHNLKLLVDLAEADIQRMDGRLRQEKDSTVLLGRERQRLEAEVEAAAAEAARAEHVLSRVVACEAGGSATLEELEEVYRELQGNFHEEYVLYNLGAAALAAALPRFVARCGGWDPLAEPLREAAAFRAWRRLLETRNASALQMLDSSNDPWQQLVSEVVLPPLRTSVTNQWQPRDPAPLERFLEVWEPLLPPPLLHSLLHSLVLPKLRTAVAAWEPLRDTVALHTWLHPWLPYLGDSMAELWPAIRFKFGAALTAWQPWDASALTILSPWHKVFSPRDWESLVGASILPKLAGALQQLVINPVAQQLEPLHWVLAWADVLPERLLVQLLEAHLFPQWHAVLAHWLANSPNFDEVTRWYLGWKSVLPQSLLDNDRIRYQLTSALNAMNSAVDGRPPPPTAPLPVLPPEPLYAAAPAAAPPVPPYAAAPAPAAAAPDLSLRGLVETFATDNDVALVPKPGRTHAGLQVYGFGPVSVVLDAAAGAISAQFGERWVPVSLETLLTEARNREARATTARV